MRDRLANWKELLESCGRKPTRKHVHALRVVTLRMQAELEQYVAELPSASHQAQAIFRFAKNAEKLRRALGPVRELDVSIGKLGQLRASLDENAEYVPRSTRECVREIDRLQQKLRQRRRAGEKKLVSEIEKRRNQLEATAREIGETLDDRQPDLPSSTAGEIIFRFEAVAAKFPKLDNENLHEFRKEIKGVRYLAEIADARDADCGRIAGQVKKLQSAIGEWHDWQALAIEAHKSSRFTSLAEMLDSLVSESFDAAIDASGRITERLLNHRRDPALSLQKLPVHGVGPLQAIGDKKSA